MKRAFIVTLLTLSGFLSFGQKVHFSDTSNVWLFWEWSSAIPISPVPYTDSYMGDTLIHSVLYKKLHHLFLLSTASSFVFVREDTTAHKVYAIAAIYPDDDTTEQLLYDYTLNIGDTFRSKHCVHYVTTIDSILINAVWHKVWGLFPYSSDSTVIGLSTNPYFVIEGIGSINNPCFPHSPYTFETQNDLSCFHNNGITPPLSHTVGLYFNNTSSCSLSFGLGNSVTVKNKNAEIYPNPIDNTSKITLPYNILSGNITVINNIGQVVIKTPVQNKEEILIGDRIKVPGIYYYRVIDEQSGKVFSGKFVRQ